MAKWYYLVKGQQEGPVSQEELLQKFTGEELPAETFIWSKGMTDWLKASDVDGFLSQETATPPPIEPEPPAAPADDTVASEATAAAPKAAGSRLALARKEEPAPAQTEDQAAAPAQGAVMASVMGQQQFQPPTQAEAAYLYISPFRLIFMSIFSFGVYELYWIYKNWRYAKDRDGLDIMPFWRGWFGIFHCHNLLRYIHTDRVLTRYEEPKFKPGLLATIWVIMKIIENISARIGSNEITSGTLLGPFWPSFLCFLPVQIYINRVNKQMAPDAKKTGFTLGHIVITIFSLIPWSILVATIFFHDQILTYLESMPK